jgi:hypothetical protein
MAGTEIIPLPVHPGTTAGSSDMKMGGPKFSFLVLCVKYIRFPVGCQYPQSVNGETGGHIHHITFLIYEYDSL